MTYKGTLTYLEVQSRILRVPRLRERAFLATVFLTAGRVGEISRHYLDLKKTPENQRKNVPMKPKDITKTIKDNRPLIRFKVNVEKALRKKIRYVYVSYLDEKALCKPVLQYWNLNRDKRYLWDISSQAAQKWFEAAFPEFGVGIHHLRHWRITSYLRGEFTKNRIPKDIVAKIVGHRGVMTTDLYDHVEVEDYTRWL